jgi:hypothetical protein
MTNNTKLLIQDITSYNTTLSLFSDIINIGTTNSIINISGTSLYVASTDLKVNDKILSLNINPTTFTAFDIGDLSGIEIMGTTNSGFIKSNYLGSLITIKPPALIEQNILMLDNDNMYITGYSILNDNVELDKSLDVKNNMITKNMTVNSQLNIFNNLLVNNITCNSNLFISGNSILNDITSTYVFVNNNLTFNNITILSSLNVKSNVLSNNTFYNSNLTVLNTSLLNKISCLSNIQVNNNSYMNNISCLSNMNISNITILNNNTSLLSTLNINNNFIMNGNNTLYSNFKVNNDITFTNNISTKSNLNIVSKIITNLPSYDDNQSALNAGLVAGEWYRTGGVVKIVIVNVSFPYNSLYEFSGGTLNNTFWCLTDRTQGQPWADNTYPVFNPNVNWANGLSISFIATDNSVLNTGFFGFGKNGSNLEGPGVMRNQDSSYLYGTTSIPYDIGLGTNIFRGGPNKWLFVYSPTSSTRATVYVYKNNSTPIATITNVEYDYTKVNNTNVYIGRITDNPIFKYYTGSISIIRIWNNVVSWNNNYYI